MALPAASLPPARPAYIFRGHRSQIHSVHFLRDNSRLLSGDADGWVVLWSLASKRAVAVWRPHQGSVLGMQTWGAEKILTHGRDSSLKVWHLPVSAESNLSTVLPATDSSSTRVAPWLLHSLSVNTLNFAAFASCRAPQPSLADPSIHNDGAANPQSEEDALLVAVPGTNDKTVDVFQLPSERRLSSVPIVPGVDTGMIMTLGLHSSLSSLQLLVGYESGHTAVFTLSKLSPPTWSITYLSCPHTQPVLSLAAAPSLSSYYTTSADAVLAAHPLTPSSPPTPSSATPQRTPTALPLSAPLKTSNTAHAGQQSAAVRSDAKVIATAGWDARVRVYAARSLRELAVLKWHREGVYAVDFADVGPAVERTRAEVAESESGEAMWRKEQAVVDVRRDVGTGEWEGAAERRERVARTTHWLAAGAKDGNVSLWEIY